MDKYLAIVYFITFLGSIIVILKILLESNLHTFFKKGRINQIRFAYIIIAIILSFLFTSAIIKLIETMLLIVK